MYKLPDGSNEGDLFQVTGESGIEYWKPYQVAKANYDDLQKKAKQVPAKHWAILIGLLVFDLIWSYVFQFGYGEYLFYIIIVLFFVFRFFNKAARENAEDAAQELNSMDTKYLDYLRDIVDRRLSLNSNYWWYRHGNTMFMYSQQGFVYYNLSRSLIAYSRNQIKDVKYERIRRGSHTSASTTGGIDGTAVTVGSSFNRGRGTIIGDEYNRNRANVNMNGSSINFANTMSHQDVNVNTESNTVEEYELKLIIYLNSAYRPSFVVYAEDDKDGQEMINNAMSMLRP